MVSEIKIVYLTTKDKLKWNQESKALDLLKKQAKDGFKIEIQCEVLLLDIVFIVWQIEPANKFYGMVDENTVFKIVYNKLSKPAEPLRVTFSTTNSLIGLTGLSAKEVAELKERGIHRR